MPSSRTPTEVDTSEPPTKRARVEVDGERESTSNGGSIRLATEGQKLDEYLPDEDEEGDATRRRRKAAVAEASRPSDMYLDTVMCPCLTTVASSHKRAVDKQSCLGF